MDPIYTVQTFNEHINTVLLQSVGEVSIKGEITGYREPYQKFYTFFDLKDSDSVLNCYVTITKIDFPIRDGQEVIVTGTPKIYVPSGKFSFTVRTIQLTGDGAIRKAFEELKNKLEKEGLFEARHKKVLPRFPERVGIITSGDGAAINDIQRVIHSRWGGLGLFLLPVRVQGREAPDELVQAIDYFNKYFPVDIIIFGRGGGSLEDLQAFNSERVARALFASRIPIVTGIGHEHNTSIADLVADKPAATPTMAATIAIPDRDHVRRHIELNKQQMFGIVGERLIRQRQQIRQHIHRLQVAVLSRLNEVALLLQRFRTSYTYYRQKIALFKQQITTFSDRLPAIANQKLTQEKLQITERVKLLHALNPSAILERGYSITYCLDSGKPIIHLADLPRNGKIKTQVSDGEFESVTHTPNPQSKLF